MGGGEEKEVVGMEVDVEEEEVEGRRREVMGMAMPRMPVRVLLVEGDDSTRQIIAALLRKCGYRVAAASNGVKAWEALKEKSFNIDLVLTEVDLPLMSGFMLLSTITEHEGCKNIPVIMMSSHDSISMVFKCMLKGAADFLVKPIRKNELRNLWQHVWRKHITNGGPHVKYAHQDEHVTEEVEQRVRLTNREHLLENVAQTLKYQERSEQESDAQSSCTRSEMEAESKHVQNMPEGKPPTRRELSTADHADVHMGEETKNETSKDEELIPRTDEGLTPSRQPCKDNICEKASKVIDVVHVIENQHIYDSAREIGAVKNIFQVNDMKCSSNPMPPLELSLRRSECNGPDSLDKCERRTLNHSSLSAFSLYNCRPAGTSCNAGDAPACSGSSQNSDMENKFVDSTAPSQDITAAPCAPIRVIPFSIPAGGFSFDKAPYWNSPTVPSLFYPQATHPLWSNNASMWQEATMHTSPSQQVDPKVTESKQVEDRSEHIMKSLSHSARMHEHTEALLDEQRHASFVTGENESSSMQHHDGARSTLSSSGCDSASNLITGHIESCNRFNGMSDNTSSEGLRCLSQREVALNKFRLKRKERCFEKKVRYQSRKLLAEQRPRVKGQFVRQVHGIQ